MGSGAFPDRGNWRPTARRRSPQLDMLHVIARPPHVGSPELASRRLAYGTNQTLLWFWLTQPQPLCRSRSR